MYRNPDPKPGCWVLPVVVIGMIAFTWFFVQRLEPDEIEPDTPPSTTTTLAEETSQTTTPGQPEEETTTTSTTLLSPELQTYLNNLTEDRDTLAALVMAMDRANTDWDDRDATGVTYGETESIIEDLAAQALVFSQAVELHAPPPSVSGLVEAHGVALQSALEVASAADEVLVGLQAPDTGELRRTALLKFRADSESFNLAVEEISNIILQRTG